jgi:hypothetical protein
LRSLKIHEIWNSKAIQDKYPIQSAENGSRSFEEKREAGGSEAQILQRTE